MSYVLAAPEMIATAATDVAAVGSTLSAEHVAAAASTVTLLPAAADEVSVSIAHLFSRYAQDYQSLAGQAAAFHEQFVQHLNASAGSYASTEAANAASLQHLTASAGSSARSVAVSQSEPPIVANAAWLLGQIVNVYSRLGELPLPAPLITALQTIWFISTLPISLPAAFIIILWGL